jgi:hypothetical protein
VTHRNALINHCGCSQLWFFSLTFAAGTSIFEKGDKAGEMKVMADRLRRMDLLVAKSAFERAKERAEG